MNAILVQIDDPDPSPLVRPAPGRSAGPDRVVPSQPKEGRHAAMTIRTSPSRTTTPTSLPRGAPDALIVERGAVAPGRARPAAL